jgi:hypothetical protein
MEKPTYKTSKAAIWLSSAAAWVVILMLAAGAAWQGQATAFGTIALPSMVTIILGLLGIHRGFGSLDMHLQTRHKLVPPASADQPEPQS